MRKHFKIPCMYSVWGTTIVSLEIPDGISEEEIKSIVLDYAINNIHDLELPVDPEYIEDSFQIDTDSTIEEI